jgi:uncharacterized membrane protein YfcA
MIALGYVLGLLIGICLGMMGAGGAIMTIPVLVYLFEIDIVTATFYSLFIVGLTALIGTYGYIKNGLFDFKTVIFFGLPSIFSILLTTRVLAPTIPTIITEIGSFTLTKDILILFLFAILMIISAIAMLRSSRAIIKDNYEGYQRYRYGLIMLQGILVGMLTGFLGAGGGFLIIPALVVLAHLPMKKAVGTSLCIITINCAFGFISRYSQIIYVDWEFLLYFTSLTCAGIISGIYFSRNWSGAQLKKGFAYFMLTMGTFIIVKESVFKQNNKNHQEKPKNTTNIEANKLNFTLTK